MLRSSNFRPGRRRKNIGSEVEDTFPKVRAMFKYEYGPNGGIFNEHNIMHFDRNRHTLIAVGVNVLQLIRLIL